MNDVELLPLPEPMRVLGTIGKDAAEAWCRANMAPLIAEIEQLRAEREVIGAEATKYAGKSGRLQARAERLETALRGVMSAVYDQMHENEQCVIDARNLLSSAPNQTEDPI